MTVARAATLTCVAVVCACECGAPPLAVLQAVDGTAVRDHSAAVGTWSQAAVGAHFELGDGLKTGVRTTAEVRVRPQTLLQVEPETIVRFSATRPEAPPGLTVETGAVTVETSAESVEVTTTTGSARVARGSRARVRSTGGQIRFDVAVGRVVIETPDGERSVGAGRSFELLVGNAMRELGPPVAVAPNRDAGVGDLSDDSPELGTTADGGPPEVASERPLGESRGRTQWLLAASDAVDITLRPDTKRATVHTPDGQARLRTPWPCPAAGSLEVRRGRQVLRHPAAASVGLSLGPGAYTYRIRCAGTRRPAITARVLVRRDAARRRLPLRPPEASVRADGRRYTVHYQNQLPALSLQWPDAPASEGYTLTLASKVATIRRAARQPRVHLVSGRVPEGRYRFFFESAGKRSPPTDLVVAFDNAARAASLSKPAPAGYPDGQAVVVTGVAMVGSRVTVADQPVALRADGRFRVQLADPGQAVAVRVSHPKSGVHYYLRRSK